MEIKKLLKHFPIFTHTKSGARLVYLDSAATSQKPDSVINAIHTFYSTQNATVHRGIYTLSELATTQFEAVRENVAKFINAVHSSEIIFTSGATEGINFIADTWGRANLAPGDEIVLTRAEHHANFLPWQRLAQKSGAKLKFIELDRKTFLVPEEAVKIITSKTKLVALTHISNVLGNIWSEGLLEKVIARAHAVGAKVLLDAAQSAAHRIIDVQKLKPDFLVFSGHKMLAPTGVGILYINKDFHGSIEPYRLGGSMVFSTTYEKSIWREAPYKFEAGTPAIEAIIGLGVAIDFLREHVDVVALQKYEAALCKNFIQKVLAIQGCKIIGNTEQLGIDGHLVTFTIDGVHAHDLAGELSNYNIAVRAGHHCAQPLAIYLGIETSIRVSFYLYNSLEDVEACVEVLRTAVKRFRDD